MVRVGQISDDFWAVVEPLLPVGGGRGRPWADHRLVLEGVCWRYRTGSPWRDLPAEFGPWQTVWKRHFLWSTDGTYQEMFNAALDAGIAGDLVGDSGGGVSADGGVRKLLLAVDSTVTRAHQHSAGARKDSVLAGARGHTGGWVELQESADRTS